MVVLNLSEVEHFLQPQESEEVEPEEPLEDETKIPMSDTAEDYYYDQYDGTRAFYSHNLSPFFN